jgi:hypothetical protein
MSPTWIDEPTESAESMVDEYGEEDSGAIGGDYGESYLGDPLDAESRISNARRARARRIALARSRAARARTAPTPPRTVAAAVNRTQAAVREVDLQSKVQADALHSRLAHQGKRIDRGELAFMATIVERQLESSFPSVVENRIVAAGLRASPLLLLKPSWRRDGVGGYLGNPQLLGAGLVVGLTIAGELRRKSQDVRDVRITRFERHMPVNGSIRFRADPLDENDRVIGEKRQTIHWETSEPAVATVNTDTGDVKAVSPGNVTITARGERPDLFDQALVTVNRADSGSP